MHSVTQAKYKFKGQHYKIKGSFATAYPAAYPISCTKEFGSNKEPRVLFENKLGAKAPKT
jgi:hypothetical protein